MQSHSIQNLPAGTMIAASFGGSSEIIGRLRFQMCDDGVLLPEFHVVVKDRILPAIPMTEENREWSFRSLGCDIDTYFQQEFRRELEDFYWQCCSHYNWRVHDDCSMNAVFWLEKNGIRKITDENFQEANDVIFRARAHFYRFVCQFELLPEDIQPDARLPGEGKNSSGTPRIIPPVYPDQFELSSRELQKLVRVPDAPTDKRSLAFNCLEFPEGTLVTGHFGGNRSEIVGVCREYLENGQWLPEFCLGMEKRCLPRIPISENTPNQTFRSLGCDFRAYLDKGNRRLTFMAYRAICEHRNWRFDDVCALNVLYWLEKMEFGRIGNDNLLAAYGVIESVRKMFYDFVHSKEIRHEKDGSESNVFLNRFVETPGDLNWATAAQSLKDQYQSLIAQGIREDDERIKTILHRLNELDIAMMMNRVNPVYGVQ